MGALGLGTCGPCCYYCCRWLATDKALWLLSGVYFWRACLHIHIYIVHHTTLIFWPIFILSFIFYTLCQISAMNIVCLFFWWVFAGRCVGGGGWLVGGGLPCANIYLSSPWAAAICPQGSSQARYLLGGILSQHVQLFVSVIELLETISPIFKHCVY